MSDESYYDEDQANGSTPGPNWGGSVDLPAVGELASDLPPVGGVLASPSANQSVAQLLPQRLLSARAAPEHSFRASPGSDFGPAAPMPMPQPPAPLVRLTSAPAGSVGEDGFPSEASHMLGLSVLFAGAGAFVGHRYGGMQGALSGSLFGGAAVNAYRALKYWRQGTPAGDHEAKISGTYAVFATALGIGLWIKLAPKERVVRVGASPPGRVVANIDEGGDAGGVCRIRPVGP